MSELNGDKARFQRLRKAAVRRRAVARATQDALRLQAATSRGVAEGEQSGGVRGRVGTLRPEQQKGLVN